MQLCLLSTDVYFAGKFSSCSSSRAMFSSDAVASSRVATGSKSSYYAMKLGPLSSISLLFALELNSEPLSEEMDEELERNDIANLYFVSLRLSCDVTRRKPLKEICRLK